MGLIVVNKGALWLHGLIEDLKIHHKHICLFCDGQSSIHLEKDQVRYSWTQHVVDKEDILFQKNRIADNLANMMTKPVPLHKFKYYFELILVWSLQQSLGALVEITN